MSNINTFGAMRYAYCTLRQLIGISAASSIPDVLFGATQGFSKQKEMRMYGLDLAGQTKCDIAYLASAYVVVFGSLLISINVNDPNWFSRSGSIMVLFAAIIEYRNLALQQTINEKASEGAGTLRGGGNSLSQPRFRQLLGKFTHLTVGLGTVIWGYGDLLVPLKT